VKARKAKAQTPRQCENWEDYLRDEFGREIKTSRIVPVVEDKLVMIQHSVNQKIVDWWREQRFILGNNPRLLQIRVVDGVVHYNPTEWAKRGGRDVLVGLLAEWYPEQRIVLMDELAVA
jgi:hypothetical protein